ncbi:hypothetical protein ZTR_07719 [Talaromyces verruculosus]|nr:hypothetical protein ZTR_07719 [Talaromyces verruculosus]
MQFSKTAMPRMASRITHTIRPQIRPTSQLLSSTSRTYSSSLFSSISSVSPKRPSLPPTNNTTTTTTMATTALINQIRSFSASAALAEASTWVFGEIEDEDWSENYYEKAA